MADVADGHQRVGLAAAIAELRRELSLARQQGEGKDIRFRTGEIEVELGLEFGWTKEANGGFKLFSFLDLGAKAGSSDKTAHKVKIKLTIDNEGSPTANLINDPSGPKLTLPIPPAGPG